MTAILLIAGLIAAVLIIFIRPDRTEAPGGVSQGSQTPSSPKADQDGRKHELIDLQPVIDKWASGAGGNAGVVIYDLENSKTVAALNPDRSYFAASIYKLYVAYIGYQKNVAVTDGLNRPYLGDWTRGRCLDEMIRTSHSPCAEKMWIELGKEQLTRRLTDYGLRDTSMTGLYTTAHDATVLLRRLFGRFDLSNDHTRLLLASMKSQIYRDALQAGFETAAVYDKVGFREDDEYHDVGLISIKGRNYAVSVLTDGIGAGGIRRLAADIEAKLNKEL